MAKIQDALRTFWNILTGRTLLHDIAEADELIQRWYNVYKGDCPWLAYTYIGLSGTKRERVRESMHAAKLICSELAGLVWAETPKVDVDPAIADMLKREQFYQRAVKMTEYGAALGGFAWKLYSPDGNELKIDGVTADCFIPVTYTQGGVITEADFVSRLVNDGKTYLIIEQHRVIPGGYRITREAYVEINSMYEKRKPEDAGLSSEPVDIMTTVPLFVYVPTSEANNFSMTSPLGISIFANALGTLKSLDIAFDALHHEIVMGKRRIIVPASSVRSVIGTDGKPVTYFDPSDEAFIAFNNSEAQDMKIVDNTVEIRIESIRLAIQTLLNILSVQVGFSAGYLSFDAGGLKTATEVISENSKTYKTKQAYENNIGSGMLALFEAIRVIGPAYGIATTSAEYSVEWNDAIIEDRAAKEKRINERVAAGTMSKKQAIMELDGKTEAEAAAIVAEINKENATIDVSFGGL